MATLDEDDAVEACCNFLDDLISDKVAVFGSATEGGGWIYLSSMPAVTPDDAMYTSSGPAFGNVP